MTAQMSEVLVLDGEETSMTFCPPLPLDSPHIEIVPEDEVKGWSTACWRRYIGVWEIADGKFYLNDIRGPYRGGVPAFRKLAPDPLFANWFTGVLRLPRGELKRYVHMGFGSVYEAEEHIKIVEGFVVGRRVIDTSEGRQRGSNFPGEENRFDGDEW